MPCLKVSQITFDFKIIFAPAGSFHRSFVAFIGHCPVMTIGNSTAVIAKIVELMLFDN